MRAVVPVYVDVAVRRPTHVAGEVVAKRWEGLPAILAEGPRRRRDAGRILANQGDFALPLT